MEKKTFSSLLEGRLFKIPDYQRGYAWGEKQWSDFVQDIDALIGEEEEILNHYTGTVVLYQKPDRPVEDYGIDSLDIVEVVDGQQRLITCSLYLSIIINDLIRLGVKAFEEKIPVFLRNGSKSKLQLNNDSTNFYLSLIEHGISNTPPHTTHQKQLEKAYEYLNIHIEKK